MRIRSRLAAWMTAVGICLLLTATGLSTAFVGQWEQTNGAVGLNKVAATVDLAADPSGAAGLTADDMSALDRKWSAGRTSYLARTAAKVEAAGGRSANAEVLGVNAGYAAFNGLQARPGSLIGAVPVAEASRVAVVSAELAERLFGSRQIIGLTVRLLNEPFRIIGVAEATDAGSLLRSMADNGTPDVYIPVTTLLELDSRVRIGTVELETDASGLLSGEDQARAALSAIGKPPSRFAFVNFARERRWTAQKPALARLALGAAAALLALRLAAGRLRRLAALAADGLRRRDGPDLLRAEGAQLARPVLAAAAFGACALLAAACARFAVYIPPRLLPEQWIDVSFYVDLLQQAWQRQAAGMGYVASPPEWLWQRADALVTGLTAAGLLLGVALTRLGQREEALLGVPIAARLARLSLALTAGVVLNAAAAAWAGAAYTIRPGELYIVAAFAGFGALTTRHRATIEANSNSNFSSNFEYADPQVSQASPSKPV